MAAQLSALREEITSFKALDAEVCIACDAGEIWLVPEYTGRRERKELSLRDAATIAAISAAFPGATVTSFEVGKENQKKFSGSVSLKGHSSSIHYVGPLRRA